MAPAGSVEVGRGGVHGAGTDARRSPRSLSLLSSVQRVSPPGRHVSTVLAAMATPPWSTAKKCSPAGRASGRQRDRRRRRAGARRRGRDGDRQRGAGRGRGEVEPHRHGRRRARQRRTSVPGAQPAASQSATGTPATVTVIGPVAADAGPTTTRPTATGRHRRGARRRSTQPRWRRARRRPVRRRGGQRERRGRRRWRRRGGRRRGGGRRGGAVVVVVGGGLGRRRRSWWTARSDGVVDAGRTVVRVVVGTVTAGVNGTTRRPMPAWSPATAIPA